MVISFFLVGLLTFFITTFLLKWVPNGFLDQPTSVRKRHVTAIPCVGGIAFVIAILLMAYIFDFLSVHYLWYACGGSLIFLLGLLDDRWGLPWYVKLFTQGFIGVSLFLFLNGAGDLSFLFGVFLEYSYLHIFLWIFWFLGMVNAVNLTDGLDGLAAGLVCLSVIGAGVFGFMSFQLMVVAALLVFLVFNRFPAKIYMGDCGSLFLGYHLAVTPLLFSFSVSTSFSLIAYLMMGTYFIWDTVRVVVLRMMLGGNPFKPDQKHFHFVLLRYIQSKSLTVTLLYALHAYFVFCGVGVVLSDYSLFVWIMYFLGIVCLIGFPFFEPLIKRNKLILRKKEL
ncbi:hypothetical protein DID74_00160 [Candidatus Marinamargulisbacteria bacterium SCGC AG-333-B06]|nr:hypothetical protein DID74_00160 [Candidatus Marinamargulisbacteria bacterium SCGC AG-333-B06]